MSGVSAMAWPMLIHRPASESRRPRARVRAVMGPGAITPDSEIATTIP
ncbi:MAG: hypothetical protein QF787_17360 [Nitrospinota bacterium]|nr:hypothetical protein [Nitrospinota bacterium]